jgi:hypothetical protein
LGAYFDDSGTDRANRAAVVGGYLGSEFQWKRFEARWSSTLNSENVKILRRSALENFRGEFAAEKGWDEARRKSFVKKLHSVIKTRTYTAVSAAVVK